MVRHGRFEVEFSLVSLCCQLLLLPCPRALSALRNCEPRMPHHRALWTHFTPRRSHVAPPPPARDSRLPDRLSGLLKIAASAGPARDGGCGDHHCVSISTGPRCGQGKSSPLPSRPLLLGPKRVVLIPIVALAKKGLIPSDKRPGKGLSLSLSSFFHSLILS